MPKDTIAIIDYGSGNLRSAAKSFEHVIAEQGLNQQVILTDKAEEVAGAQRIVLPGQGAFGDCMSGLKAVDGMIEVLTDSVMHKGTPFLGICVGMQLLATRGLEHGEHAGLGWVPGDVEPMKPSDNALKIPHMGWNDVALANAGNPHPVLQSITKSAPHHENNFYFVHSFMVHCKDDHHVLAVTDYGGQVTAIIGRDNIIGTQFHVEKSHEAGLKLISDFIDWKP